MTRVPRFVIGSDGSGWHGLRIAREGYDALAVSPDEFQKLIFDSNWALPKIHQSGYFVTYHGWDPPGLPADYASTGTIIYFPDPGYVPLVTLRWSKTAGMAEINGDYWWTVSSGGEDAYATVYNIYVARTHFIWKNPVFNMASIDSLEAVVGGKGVINGGTDLSLATYYANYVVWKLPVSQ